jgi:hypothetical protein
MEVKQTAVGWLEKMLVIEIPTARNRFRKKKIVKNLSFEELSVLLEQALKIEKEQIIEAHAVGRIKECSGINTDGEQYYNETFKSE